MSDSKPFSETKVGQFLTQKLPEVATNVGQIVGGILPNNGYLGIIKNIISTSPEIPAADKLSMVTELHQYELNLEAEDTKRIQSYNDVEKAQVSSEDNYTRRARPTGQYLVWAIILACYPIAYFATGKMCILPGDIISLLGVQIGVYTLSRTAEKLNGAATNAPTSNTSILGKLLGQGK